MVSWKLKALRGRQRRDFLKLMVAAGAGLGLERSGVLNYIAGIGGTGLAEAAVGKTARALMVPGGNGVGGWMQELWPHYQVGKNITDNKADNNVVMSYLYATANGYDINLSPGYAVDVMNPGLKQDRAMVYSPDAPWRMNGMATPMGPNNMPRYGVTAIMAGNDETHTPLPKSAALVSGGSDLGATVAAIQVQLGASSIVPAIAVEPAYYGKGIGAPPITTVPSAEGLIDVFNSSASQLNLRDDADKALFETYYNALVGLRRAAPRSSWEPELAITKDAAHLIGINFGKQLTPTAQDLIDYGINDILAETGLSDKQREGVEGFARTLVVVAKAFSIGLTNTAVVGLSPYPTESSFTDPHATFASSTNKMRGRNTTKYIGKALDAFYTTLRNTPEPGSTSETMDENTVFMSWCDTPHTPLQGSGWPDATPQDCNWIYVMDPKQYIPKGWFGQVNTDQSVSGFNPVTGVESTSITSTSTSAAAGAAGAYAVAKGDWNTVAQHYIGPKPEALLKT